LRLVVMPTGSKLWHLAYRFGGKQKTYSCGIYPTVTLTAARAKRDAAKTLLDQGTDPSTAKQEAKREQAATRTFGDWADEWLVKEHDKYGEKTKTGAAKTRWVGYLKPEFGK